MPTIPQYETGAYQWRNLVNGKLYIGGAYRSFANRKKTHLEYLRTNRHKNAHLQAAWNKYGADAFVFEVLERCQRSDTKECEQRWLNKGFETPDRIYNICRFAGSSLGIKRRPETIERMRLAVTGTKQTPETIAKRVLKLKGKKRTGQALENLRAGSLKRPPVTDLQRQANAERAKIQFTRSRSGRAILSEEQVEEVRKLIAEGRSDNYIGVVLTIRATTVCDIRAGRSYRPLDKE